MDQDEVDDYTIPPDRDDAYSAAEDGALPTSPLLTAAQAAEMLCVSEATLWELVRRDRLKCVQFVATGFQRPMRRFRLHDLIRFIDESVG